MAMARSHSHETRKYEIIRASAELFERVGYHGASMQMLADSVNLGKPTLYHYFRSKTEILHAIHEDLMSDLFACHAARVAEGSTFEQLLLGICTDILRQIDEHPGYTRAFFEHYDELDDADKKEMRGQRQRYLEMVCNILEAGVESGVFTRCEPRLAALGFLGMCNWAYKWYPQESNRTVERTAQDLCQVFLEGLKMR